MKYTIIDAKDGTEIDSTNNRHNALVDAEYFASTQGGCYVEDETGKTIAIFKNANNGGEND